MSGEFEELSDIDKADINLFCAFQKMNFQKRLRNIIDLFFHEVSLDKYGFIKNKRITDGFGRKGVEFLYGTNYHLNDFSKSYGQFWVIAYYDDVKDHAIPFKKDQPEICVFFVIHPDKKELLRRDQNFTSILNKLTELGFEDNLNEEITQNSWRLFFYRKPISEFDKISAITMLEFTDEVFTKLLSVINDNPHKYFDEMKLLSKNTEQISVTVENR